MRFSAKKFFLIVFFILLLIGIPILVYFLQQQQTIQQRAEKATTLSFDPVSSSDNPIAKNVGDEIPLDIVVDPATNLVSYLKLEIQYDPDKLKVVEDSFQANSVVFPTVTEGPVFTPGKITLTLSVGADPTKAIQIKSKAASITFQAIALTGAGTPTLVTFGVNTQALSAGPSDEASENVLASSIPATISIINAEEPSPTEAPQPPITVEPSPTGTESAGTSPVCNSLVVNVTSGDPPLAVNFTASGTDPDGNITKVTFNFGDGQVSDVTTGGGIGTDSVTVQLAHTYTSSGTFQASAILTDDAGDVSSENCAQSISVSGGTAPTTPTPTIAPSGSTEVLFGIGAASILLIIGGTLLFLLL